MPGYWADQLKGRLARRRFLAYTGGLTAGAALLAACGSDSESASAKPKENKSSLVTQAVDNLKQAKSGGIYKSLVSQDVQTFEPSFRSAPTAFASAHAYQNLVSQKPGYLGPPGDEFLGDIVDSWEFSPDKLTMTMKVRTQG